MAVLKIEGIIKGSERDILYDVSFPSKKSNKLIPVVFMHGFKGYKDWGAFNLVAEKFANQGFLFLKFSFSFNGTTAEKPTDFFDLNAFGNNNFTKELDDLDQVLNFLEKEYGNRIDLEKLTLMAHSRGGATAVIKASEDSRIKKLVTWASVGTIEGRIPKLDLEEFKRTNVLYMANARTKQNMPVFYQFVEDFYKNKKRFSLSERGPILDIPTLIIHGTLDATVSIKEANHLQELISGSELALIENGDHSFGASEPWEESELPDVLETVVLKSINFIRA